MFSVYLKPIDALTPRAMNGLHIPSSPIVVDFWRVRDVPPRSLFFLTHMHAGEPLLPPTSSHNGASAVIPTYVFPAVI